MSKFNENIPIQTLPKSSLLSMDSDGVIMQTNIQVDSVIPNTELRDISGKVLGYIYLSMSSPYFENVDSNKNYKTFVFEKEIPSEYRTAFGEYFMGIKDFIFLAQGKNLGISIDINGSLKITIHSNKQEDIELVEKAFVDFIQNVIPILNDEQPIIQTPVTDILKANKMMIILTNKIRGLENSMMSNKLIYTNQLIERDEIILDLKSTMGKLQTKVKTLNHGYNQLQDDFVELHQKLKEVKNLLIQERLSAFSSDTSDSIVGLLSQIKLTVDQKDIPAIKKTTNFLKDFITLNEAVIKIIPIPKLLETLKALISEINKKY